MRNRRYSRTLLIALLIGFCLPIVSSRLYAQGTGGSLTNTAPVVPGQRKDSLRLLEEQLSRVLQGLAPRNGDVASPALTRQPSVQRAPIAARKDKDKIDLEKDWMYLSSDDLTKFPSMEEILNLPEYDKNGVEKPKMSAMERFYENLGKDGSSIEKLDSKGDKNDRLEDSRSLSQSTKRKQEEEAPSAIRQTEESLRDLLKRNPFGTASSDLVGRGSSQDGSLGRIGSDFSTSRSSQQNPWIQQYRQMLGESSVGKNSSIDSLNSQMNRGQMNPGLSTLPSITGNSGLSSRPAPELSRGANPIFSPSAIQDHNSRVINSWNPVQSAPVFESRRPASAPIQQVEPGRRRF